MSTRQGARRAPRERALQRHRERGTGTLEYVGAIAMAALLATGTLVALEQGHLEDIARNAYCRVMAAATGGSCAPSGSGNPKPKQPFDPKPTQCTVSTDTQKMSGVVKIAFITLGHNSGFIETVYSDGSVSLTATDGSSAGAEGGFGAKFDIGKVKAGYEVNFGAGVEYTYGSTWTFPTQDAADQMEQSLKDYEDQQEEFELSPADYAWHAVFGGIKKPPRSPDQTVQTFTVDADASGTVGVELPWDKDNSSSSPTSAASSGEGDENLPEGPSVGAEIGASTDWSMVTDNNTGDQTYTTDYSAYASANGTVGPLSGQLKGLLGSSLSITRDKSGQVTNVTVTSTTSGSASGSVDIGDKKDGGQANLGGGKGNLHVTTTSLDVSNDQQRAEIQQWMQSGAPLTNDMITPKTETPGDPIQNLFYQQAQVSQVDYKDVDNSAGFAAEVKLGVEVGVDFSSDDDKSTAVDADYLGAPGDNGVREPVDFPECLGH